MEIKNYDKLIKSLARKYSRNEMEYEDLKSDFYLVFMEKKETFDPKKAKFSTFLYKNCTFFYLNKRKKAEKEREFLLKYQNSFEIYLPKDKEFIFEELIKEYPEGLNLWNMIKDGFFFPYNKEKKTWKRVTLNFIRKELKKFKWTYYEIENSLYELKTVYTEVFLCY